MTTPHSSPVTDTAIPLADHNEIGRKVLTQPWAIQSAIVTITAHCRVLVDEHPTGKVAELAGCISQGCLELADALAGVSPDPQIAAESERAEGWKRLAYATADECVARHGDAQRQQEGSSHGYMTQEQVDAEKGIIRDSHKLDQREMDAAIEAIKPVNTPAQRPLSEEERHAIGHARYQVSQASMVKPDCCFDYDLVKDLLRVIDRAYSVTSTERQRGTDLIDGGVTAFIESIPTDAETRAQIVKECVDAAIGAFEAFGSEKYVMHGPGGLARYMMDAIAGVALTRPVGKPVDNTEGGA